jgi:poly(3-hydroxybutyrate) depolymerase
MILRNLLAVPLLFLSLSISAQTPGVEKSWERGIAYIPNQFFNKSPPDVVVDKKYPVLILMHGCTGITQEERSWANIISKLGFVVVLPDSFARPGRVANCNAQSQKSSWAFPLAEKYRQEEISYILEKLQTVNWSDKNNIFLMGHSEGGRASALSSHSGIKGKIISGWTCGNGLVNWYGINGEKNMPMLAVAYLNDPWRGGLLNRARCSDYAQDIISFTQINLDGQGHATSSNYVAKDHVKNFLVTNLTKIVDNK